MYWDMLYVIRGPKVRTNLPMYSFMLDIMLYIYIYIFIYKQAIRLVLVHMIQSIPKRIDRLQDLRMLRGMLLSHKCRCFYVCIYTFIFIRVYLYKYLSCMILFFIMYDFNIIHTRPVLNSVPQQSTPGPGTYNSLSSFDVSSGNYKTDFVVRLNEVR
jgi:hypothetical protein